MFIVIADWSSTVIWCTIRPTTLEIEITITFGHTQHEYIRFQWRRR